MNSYVQALRLPFLTGSLMPVLAGGALAYWAEKTGDLLMLGLTLLGVGSLHLGANLINDYFDAQGSDPLNLKITPFSGGSRVIQNQQFSAGTIKIMALSFFGLAIAAGLTLIYLGRPLVAVLGLLGLLGGYYYSAQPLQLMSRGLGELDIFLVFGPLITWGTYYVMVGKLKTVAFMAGVPFGFLIAAVIWINQFPDFEADREVGKYHLVAQLGLAASRWVYAGLMLGPFIFLLILVEVYWLPDLLFAALLPLPLAVRAIRLLWRHYQTYEEIIPAQALTLMVPAAWYIIWETRSCGSACVRSPNRSRPCRCC
ncbi:MAG: 1,4-dihydroxy-2-naphthoate octaprenyltransferase [Desulfobacca sp. 4484_104]|nr:MAG: 1,4-dihydroxy-2-naphthoate octaprenyltransferase [Desulfobacca sp. 4484_104]